MQALSRTLLAAALLASASPTLAATAPKGAAVDTGATGDVRCLLTMVAFANLNKDHPQAGQAGVYYFTGRLSAEAPKLDLTAAVKAQAPTLGPQQLQAELQRCGPMVDGASKRFQAAVASLRPPAAAGAAPGAAAPAAAAPAPAAPAAAPKPAAPAPK